jgi:hypothetical protein
MDKQDRLNLDGIGSDGESHAPAVSQSQNHFALAYRLRNELFQPITLGSTFHA